MNPPIGVLVTDTLTSVPGTLASRLADADEDRFVGRRSELGFFDPLLDGEGDVAVVLVHGRAGIGKSTLLREVVRRRRKRGWKRAAGSGSFGSSRWRRCRPRTRAHS